MNKAKPTRAFVQFEDDVTTAIEFALEVTRSDAQGIVEANQALLSRLFADGIDAATAADRIANV